MHCVARHCMPLRCATLKCTVLQCSSVLTTAFHCNALLPLCTSLRCPIPLQSAALHRTVPYSTLLQCMRLHSSVLRCTPLKSTLRFWKSSSHSAALVLGSHRYHAHSASAALQCAPCPRLHSSAMHSSWGLMQLSCHSHVTLMSLSCMLLPCVCKPHVCCDFFVFMRIRCIFGFCSWRFGMLCCSFACSGGTLISL